MSKREQLLKEYSLPIFCLYCSRFSRKNCFGGNVCTLVWLIRMSGKEDKLALQIQELWFNIPFEERLAREIYRKRRKKRVKRDE